VKLHQLGGDAAGLSISSSHRVGLRTGLLLRKCELPLIYGGLIDSPFDGLLNGVFWLLGPQVEPWR
jgi:hypothetical protein